MIDRFTKTLNRNETVYLLILLAFLIRAGFGIAIGNRYLPMADQPVFDELARNLADGRGLMITDRLIDPPSDAPPEVLERYLTAPERVRDLRLRALYGVLRPNQPTAFVEPMVPLIFGFIYKIFGPGIIIPRLLQSFLDALVVGMIFLIGRMALPKSRAPGIAALIYVFYPFSIMFTGALITQPIYLFLQCASIYLFYRLMVKGRAGTAVLFGIAFGMTILTRISIITFAPCFLIAVWFQRYRKPNWAWTINGLLLAAILLLPWIIRNQQELGEPLLLPTKGGRNLWEYNNQNFSKERIEGSDFEGVDILYNKFALKHIGQIKGEEYIEFPEFHFSVNEIERDKILNHNVLEFIKANPVIFAKLCVLRFYQFFRVTPSHHPHLFFKIAAWGSFGWILPLSLIGALLLLPSWRKMLLIYLLIGYNIATHTLTASGIPHRLPIDPFLILLAAYSLHWIGTKTKILKPDKEI
ncbi:glycosyltransferase family 39 protein [bacterium]|nr:glycosyltransferase family 39 protein [bacterium]